MLKRELPVADASMAEDPRSRALKRQAALELAGGLADMAFPDRRTALLVLARLVRSDCDATTIRATFRYLSESDVIPQLTALRLHCGCTFRHSLRTIGFSVLIAVGMGIDRYEHAQLCVGALLHDIGKLAVPVGLLAAPRKLRPAEVEIMRSHAETGYESISDKRIFGWNAVLDIVRHHHERLDGSGYPLGLTAERISWRTRCVSVADIYSALTENRPYRAALRPADAFRLLTELAADGKLDGELVGALGDGLAMRAPV